MISEASASPRFRRFPVRYRHTDALIGVNGLTIGEGALRERLLLCLDECYQELEREMAADDKFSFSLSPRPGPGLTPIGQAMKKASASLDLGPMAAVAGAVSQRIVGQLAESCREIYCENGGDIAVVNREEMKISVFTGGAPFNRPLYLQLPPGRWGIASSSGLYGHSYSRGQAQMVTIVAADALLADAAATAVANRILPGCDPQRLVEEEIPGVSAKLVFWGENMYYQGLHLLDFS